MPTFWNSPLPIEAEQWDGSYAQLAKIAALVGQDLADDDGVVLVTSSDGEKVYQVQIGQMVYVDHIGIAVRDADRVGEWLTEDPRAA